MSRGFRRHRYSLFDGKIRIITACIHAQPCYFQHIRHKFALTEKHLKSRTNESNITKETYVMLSPKLSIEGRKTRLKVKQRVKSKFSALIKQNNALS